MLIQQAFVVASLIAQVITPTGQVASDQPRQTFRSALDVVTVHASVRDRQGRLVTGLTPADFEIRDNGQLRPILSVRADRQSPVALAIVVDMSGSMRLSGKMQMAREAYATVLSLLRQGEDEAGVFTFDEGLRERRGFTRDIASLRDGLADFDAFGSTSLYDATASVARQLAARSGGHKAIVVLTDGTDTSSTMTPSDVSGLAASIDVPIYVVATVPSAEQRELLQGSARTRSMGADLRNLAEWTGGQFIFASTEPETVRAAAALIADLRHRYLLSIEAASEKEWRRLDVRVRRTSSVVKARAGYFGG